MRRWIVMGLMILGIAGSAWAEESKDLKDTTNIKKDIKDSKNIKDIKVEKEEKAVQEEKKESIKEEKKEKDTEGARNVAPVSIDDDAPLKSEVPKDRMPSLSLEVHPKEASVGEVVTWQLTVKHKKEDSVHLEGGASFGGLEIKSRDKSETPSDNSAVVETLKVMLIGFEPGDITIPKQKLTVVDFEGRIAEVNTSESFVTVKSLIANEPEPKIKEDGRQGEIVLEKDYLLLWILGILAGVGLVAALTLVGRKLWAMRKPKPLPPPPPPRPAEEIALEKLEGIRRSNLLAEGQIKEFHVRLSEAVREYIGNRYKFDSLELSSEELIQAIRKIKLSRSEYELILDFLGETDLVKFAKALPTIQESEDLLTQSFGFVGRTTPKSGPPNADSAKASSDGKEASHA